MGWSRPVGLGGSRFYSTAEGAPRMEAVVGAAMRAHVFDGRFKTDRGMGGEMPGQVIVHMDSAQLSFCQLLASDALGGRKVVHVSRPSMPLARCVHARVRVALSLCCLCAAAAALLSPAGGSAGARSLDLLAAALSCSGRCIRGGCSP